MSPRLLRLVARMLAGWRPERLPRVPIDAVPLDLGALWADLTGE